MFLTLKAVRISFGYTLEEAAKHCDIPENYLSELEIDSGEMPPNVAMKLMNLYGVSPDAIYFGKESDCIERNRIQGTKVTFW